MNRFYYSVLLYLATPLLILRLIWRSLRSPAYLRRWPERFGFYPSAQPVRAPLVVFHCVSVGEVHAAVPLVTRLQDAKQAADVVVTTMTPTGSARVTAMFADRVTHVYLPYDYPGAVSRFLRHFRPALLVIMETELWPNLIAACRRMRIPVALLNARLSEKSAAEYLRAPGLVRDMLRSLAVVSAQSAGDGERFIRLGLPPERLRVNGSMKFDAAIDGDRLAAARHDRQAWADRPVLIAASTRTLAGINEEDKVLAVFERLLRDRPDLLLVLVPRHPERFNAVLAMVEKRQLTVARRSEGTIIDGSIQVLLGDTMGDMAYYYGLADIAFVGGSLVDTGCQNIIEPAALGLPVLTGPSLYNFQAVSDVLLAAGGMRVAGDETALAEEILSLLEDEDARQAMGRCAAQAIADCQGATGRNLELVRSYLN